MIQLVGRIAEILDIVHASGPVPLREIAQRAGLKRTTAGNIVRSLTEAGILGQPRRGHYVIGDAIRRLARSPLSDERLREIAHRHTVRLAALSGEGVVTVILREGGLDVVAEARGDHPVQVTDRVTRDVSPYSWATGRVLLARMSPDSLSVWTRRYGLPGDLWPEIRDFSSLVRELQNIRAQGIALRSSSDHQIQSLAVPVSGTQEDAHVAALGMYIPCYRFSRETRAPIIGLLKESGERLSRDIRRSLSSDSELLTSHG